MLPEGAAPPPSREDDVKVRRLTTAGLAGGVALVVFAAMPANAAVTPVPVQPPVAPIWRSSELKALAGNASLTEAVGGITATEGAGAGVATAAGAAFAPVGVAIAGAQAIQGTSWVMHTAFHMGSGSFTCDVQTLFAANSPCANQGPPPAYAPNSDVVVTTPGWSPGNTVHFPFNNTSATVTATASTEITYAGSDPFGAYTFPAASVTIVSNLTGSDPAWGRVQSTTFVAPLCSSPTASGFMMGTGYGGAAAPSLGLSYLSETDVVSVAAGHCGSVYSKFAGWVMTHSSWGTSTTNTQIASDLAVSGNASWYYTGANPLRPPQQDTNPVRTFTTKWTCADGSTGSATSSSFREGDATWPAFPAATCPTSAGPVASATTTEDSSGVASKTVGTVDASGVSTAFAGQSATCANGGCTLDLVRIDPTTGTRLDCFAGAEACATWWTDTQQGTASGTQYDCTYGGASVALTECTVLAHAFDQGVYSDPSTGEPATDAPPATQPGSTTCPPPFSWSGLFSSWWAFKATACALQEAFVPSVATATDWQTFVGDVQTHPPVSIAMGGVQFTNDVIAGVNGQGDCSSLPLQMADQQLQGPTATFDLCAGVKQAAATTWGQAVELAVTIAIIGWASWIVMHRIGRSFGSKA